MCSSNKQQKHEKYKLILADTRRIGGKRRRRMCMRLSEQKIQQKVMIIIDKHNITSNLHTNKHFHVSAAAMRERTQNNNLSKWISWLYMQPLALGISVLT